MLADVMPPDGTAVPVTSPEEQGSLPSWKQQGFFYKVVYSLDLFLPVVNLHVDEKWEPNGTICMLYTVAHSMIGWVIVPLLLAALAGIIRR